MYSYMRTYETARTIFSILEFIGWVIVVLGVVVSFYGLSSGGIAGFAYEKPPFGLRIIAMLPGLGMILAGLISVAYTQSFRATVDMAEMARDHLKIVMGESNSADVFQNGISQTQANNVAKKSGDLNETLGAGKNYKHISFIKTEDGYIYRVDDKEFHNLEEAKEFISQK